MALFWPIYHFIDLGIAPNHHTSVISTAKHFAPNYHRIKAHISIITTVSCDKIIA